MKDTIIREFNERERAVMDKRVRKIIAPRGYMPKTLTKGCLVLLILFCLFIFLLVRLMPGWKTDPELRSYPFWAYVGGAIGAIIGANVAQIINFIKRQRYHVKIKYLLKEALEDGMVEVIRFEPFRVVIEENEYWADTHYFDIGNKQVLRMGGINKEYPGETEYLYSLVLNSKNWPNDRFEIVRTVKNKMWVGIFCFGSRLDPLSATKGHLSPEYGKFKSQVAIFNGSFHQLEETVKHGSVEFWE